MTVLLKKPQSLWTKSSRYLAQSYRGLVRNPRLFLMRKVGRLEFIRDWVCSATSSYDSSYDLTPNQPSIFENLNVDRVVSSLQTDGCYLGLNLPPSTYQELVNFAHATPCYGNRDSSMPFRYEERIAAESRYGQRFLVGSYFDTHETCAAFQQIRHDPGILAIAARFLGKDPVFLASELSWSFPTESTLYEQLKTAQVFHYDLDDYRSIKFFFYLTPVTSTCGPHVCILKSHRNKRLTHQILGQRCAGIPDDQIVDMYGAENVITICGEAGFGFVEDSCCFHKGSPPEQGDRLMLQVEFTRNHYLDIRTL